MNEEDELQKSWKQPPPGTAIVESGPVLEGDYFYIAQYGAWAPVPRSAIGQEIGDLVNDAIVVRGKIDFAKVGVVCGVRRQNEEG